MFVASSTAGITEDIIIYHDLDADDVVWFTVAQAKSYYGPDYEILFGAT
jgi:hypothetical protein